MMQNEHIVVCLMVLSLIFIEIGHFYRDQVQTRLKEPLVKIPPIVLDWWSLFHFLLFAVFGFLIPNRHLAFFTIGLLFEIFEDGMSSDSTTQLVKCTDPKIKHETMIGGIFCRGWNDSYWYMAISDPIVNLCGYVVGSSLRTSMF
jgi:hypothetical protein